MNLQFRGACCHLLGLMLGIAAPGTAPAAGPGYRWVAQDGGPSGDNGWGVALDPFGHVFSCGSFRTNAAFGGSNLTSFGGSDLFVCKRDHAGNVLWVRQAGGAGNDIAHGIASDLEGNVFVVGEFEGQATFGTNVVSSTFTKDLVLARFSAEGAVDWVQQFAADGTASCRGVACDDAGYVTVCGYFDSTLSIGEITLTTRGARDLFLARFDPAGELVWLEQAGGEDDEAAFTGCLAVDAAGTAYVTGQFRGAASFGSFMLQSAGNQDVFVAAYGTNGAALWATNFGGPGGDFGRAVAVGPGGEIFITGHFSGSPSFGLYQLFSAGGLDFFLARLQPPGVVSWAFRGGGPGEERGYAVGVDGAGTVFAAGLFQQTATFETATFTNRSAGTSNDIFVVRYEGTGTFLSAQHIGGSHNDEVNGLAVDALGNAALTGWFAESCEFTGFATLATNNSTQVFLARLGAVRGPRLEIDLTETTATLLWPRIASDFTLESAPELDTPAWTTNLPALVPTGLSNSVTVPLAAPQQFFRLRRSP